MFTGKKKLTIDKDLYAKLEDAAGKRGYSSTEEMVVHILESSVNEEEEEAMDKEQAEKQLKGLGYIS